MATEEEIRTEISEAVDAAVEELRIETIATLQLADEPDEEEPEPEEEPAPEIEAEDLTDISGIGDATAESLRAVGVETPRELASEITAENDAVINEVPGFSRSNVEADLGVEFPEPDDEEEEPEEVEAVEVDVPGEEPEIVETEEEPDVLVIGDGEASKKLGRALLDPILEEEILTFEVDSEPGLEILEQMPSDITTPFYVVATEDEFEQRPLEELVAKFA